MATPKELSEWYALLAENDNGFTYLFTEGEAHGQPPVWLKNIPERYPTPRDDLSEFKVNPPKSEIQKINMSVCIELGIDCEFESDHKSAISSLACIKNNGNYVTVKGVEFSRCKVRENKWMCNEWVIKPIPDGLSVILRFGNRESMTTVSHFPAIDWLDVESFKVLGTAAEGWEY